MAALGADAKWDSKSAKLLALRLRMERTAIAADKLDSALMTQHAASLVFQAVLATRQGEAPTALVLSASQSFPTAFLKGKNVAMDASLVRVTQVAVKA